MFTRKPSSSLYILFAACICSISTTTRAEPPLRALILTSPGVYHNYQYQSRAISEGIAERANVLFDVSLAELERWKSTDFADGYDVLIYNICMASNEDKELIVNMRRQTEELGVPAMVIHCTMHSFRNTDYWWPFYGLQSKSHEALAPMNQTLDIDHPILTGIPQGWTVGEDELYINLQFQAAALLTSQGKDGKTHVTTWLQQHGGTSVFGTTLGHSNLTMQDPVFLRLLSNAMLYVTGNLNEDGTVNPAYAANPSRGDAISRFSAPPGVGYFSEEEAKCVMTKAHKSIAPCYIGCIANPLLWGEEADACKEECLSHMPPPENFSSDCR